MPTQRVDSVSVIYYPGQEACCLGHAELVVGDTSYNLGQGCQTESLFSEKVEKAMRGKLPFQQFFLRLTESQILQIKGVLESAYVMDEEKKEAVRKAFRRLRSGEKLESVSDLKSNPKISGNSCMHCITEILDQVGGIKIPPFINLFPLTSFLYLRFQKGVGNRNIMKVQHHGTIFSSPRNFCRITQCVAGEIMLMAPVSMIYSVVKTKEFIHSFFDFIPFIRNNV